VLEATGESRRHHPLNDCSRGSSYRLKETLKAGLLRTADNTEPQPGGEV